MATNYRQLFSDAARKQAMADAMMQQATAPRQHAQGRITADTGGADAIASLGTALMARRTGKKAAEMTTQAEDARRQAQAQALAGMQGGQMQGTGDAPNNPYESAQQAIEAGVDPALVTAYMQSKAPKKPVELGYGAQLVDEQGNVLAENTRNPAGDTTNVPGSLQELKAINDDRASRGEPPMKPEEYLAQRRGASADSQLYAQYLQGLPEGVRPLPMDQFLIQFRGGVSGAQAQNTQLGESRGTAIANMPSIRNTTRMALETVDKMLAHPGMETATGLSGMIDPRNYIPGTDASNFLALKKQAQGQVFLDAFQALKGGGAITEVEGLKAEQAKARMDAAQSDEEFRAALNDYANALRRGLQVAEERTGQLGPSGGPSPAPSASTASRRFVFDPATGKLSPH